MTFRNLTSAEETILKRSFNSWGIFEIFGTLKILIRPLDLDTPISDQKTSISERSTIANKILCHNLMGNNGSNLIEKYNKDDQRRFQSSTIGHSNRIKFAESEKNIKRTEVFVLSKLTYDYMMFKKLRPIMTGLRIGTIKNKKFSPELNFAEFVVKHNSNMDYPHVIVNTKAENLIVFGRDIMGSSIITSFQGIKENQQVIILNNDKEVIGLGKSRYSGSLIIRPNKITIDTIQDIGTYYLKSENRFAKDIDKNIDHLINKNKEKKY